MRLGLRRRSILLIGCTTAIDKFVLQLSETFTLKHTTTLSTTQDTRFLSKQLQLREDNPISFSLEPSCHENTLRPYNLNNNVKPTMTACQL